MKLALLISSAIIAILMTIHILDERDKRKRIYEVEEKLKFRYKDD
ncbi:MAG: hypothetical protein ACTID1_00255 [Pseudolactococcus laudensis]